MDIYDNTEVIEVEHIIRVDNNEDNMMNECNVQNGGNDSLESLIKDSEGNNNGKVNVTTTVHVDDSELCNYASKLNSEKEIVDNKLCHIPTVLKENGHEFVIFDEEIVKEGAELSLVKDVGSEVGPSINLERAEPMTIPFWIKLVNVPLEAWSNKGLSALASRIGSITIIMDAMTTMDVKCNKKERVGDDTNKKNMMEQIKDDFIQVNVKKKINMDTPYPYNGYAVSTLNLQYAVSMPWIRRIEQTDPEPAETCAELPLLTQNLTFRT
ncbi:RNA-directed DNA polymerase, eukaryota, reverse transcriptase zinc-binding domain protein [Tanacetum coccineum]